MRVGWDENVEHNYRALVFLDEKSGDTFEMQCAITWDEQDHELGEATYCLVRGGATYYGGVLAYRLSDRLLRLELDHEAAAVLELPTSFELSLDEPQEQMVRAHLPSLFPNGPAGKS